MWDEVSAASVLDPSIITSSREMYVDVDIDHGINYGFTLAWELDQHRPRACRNRRCSSTSTRIASTSSTSSS